MNPLLDRPIRADTIFQNVRGLALVFAKRIQFSISLGCRADALRAWTEAGVVRSCTWAKPLFDKTPSMVWPHRPNPTRTARKCPGTVVFRAQRGVNGHNEG